MFLFYLVRGLFFSNFNGKVPLVTSLLLKDVDTDNVVYRTNVIRLLCHITNDTSLSQVLKCLKEARRDGNPMVENASFVCAINMPKVLLHHI